MLLVYMFLSWLKFCNEEAISVLYSGEDHLSSTQHLSVASYTYKVEVVPYTPKSL